MSEVTTIPTEPQPLPPIKLLSYPDLTQPYPIPAPAGAPEGTFANCFIDQMSDWPTVCWSNDIGPTDKVRVSQVKSIRDKERHCVKIKKI